MRKGWKRVHRLVVLPDYQGIGIGVKFINEVSKHYMDNGWDVNLSTTTPALVHALAISKEWLLIRANRVGNSMSAWEKAYGKQHEQNKGHGVHHLNNKSSKNRITYSFNFKK
jgi:GNAT superfamily N-acetyltransferase